MDVSFARGARIPARFDHRLTVSLAPPSATLASRHRTAPTSVDLRPPVIVSPPLRGHNWLVGNGCCDASTAHRGAVLPVTGALHAAGSFAIDFVQANRHGLLFSGPADSFSSYPYFGDAVLSATSGRVVRKVDNFPETPLGGFPPDITAGDAGGNYLVIAIGGGRYAFCAPHAARQHRGQGRPASSRGADARAARKLGQLGRAPAFPHHGRALAAGFQRTALPLEPLHRRRQADQPRHVQREPAGDHDPELQRSPRNELPLNLQFIDFR
jgi:hypothetical protein